MCRYNNYSFSDRKIIEQIEPVQQWNSTCHPDNKVNRKYGYVMPLFHGYHWKRTKKELINIYTFGPVK